MTELIDKPKLSVGMIVKNEERFLDDCLSALKPLLDAVSSELVIVDTGSTDATIDIARKYTDKIYNFTWINDFSAARNFGLEKCVGEWFMYIDADEIFDADISDIQNFFLKDDKKYNSAQFTEYNYNDTGADTNYAVAKTMRIFRLQKSTKFVDAVHEHINYHAPVCDLSAVLHHYGYISTTTDSKSTRNLPMMWDLLAKKPDDSRIIYHIMKENFKGKKDWILEHIPHIIKSDDYYTKPLYVLCAFELARIEEWAEVIKISDSYFERFAENNNVILIDLYFIRQTSAGNLGMHEEVVRCYGEYRRLYEMFAGGTSPPLNKELLSVYSLCCANEEYFRAAAVHAKDSQTQAEQKRAKLQASYALMIKDKDFSGAILFAFANNLDVLTAVAEMNELQISEHTVIAARGERRFVSVANSYLMSFPTEHFSGSIRNLFFLACLLENMLNRAGDDLTPKRVLELRNLYNSVVATINANLS